jgi:hypothetical protein
LAFLALVSCVVRSTKRDLVDFSLITDRNATPDQAIEVRPTRGRAGCLTDLADLWTLCDRICRGRDLGGGRGRLVAREIGVN